MVMERVAVWSGWIHSCTYSDRTSTEKQTQSHRVHELTRLHETLSLSQAGKIITTAQLPRGAVPAFLAVGGLFDADWRLAVACRSGQIYTIKVRALLLA